MTIKEVINQLQAVENKDLELYVCDNEGNNISIKDITLFDDGAEHSENNPLGINY